MRRMEDENCALCVARLTVGNISRLLVSCGWAWLLEGV
jgi:hypothetical protein